MTIQADTIESSRSNRAIGAILIDSGRLDVAGAEQILRLQKQEPELRFGDAAVQLGLVAERDIQYALSQQFVYPYLLPTDNSISQEVVAAFNPFSSTVEQLRALRSQLLLRWFDPAVNRKSLAVVSPGEGDGRSFVAANLAVVFSQLGERTLLVDADLRSPRQHSLFRLANKSGFSAVLANRAGLSECVRRIPGLLGLSVLTAGPVPPNPQELLSRPAFAKLLNAVHGHFDIVIFDTPATETVSDAQFISSQAKGALVVASKNMTQVEDLRALSANLVQNGVTVVGSLLNRI